MDIERFTEWKTGRLLPITLGGEERDWAFLPNPLPPEWEFPVYLWPLLMEAREALAHLEGAGSTLPDSRLLMRPLQRREAISSSSLEGTYATAEQLLLFEMRAKRQPKTEEERDWLEVYNYTVALRRGVNHLLGEDRITLNLVREMHGLLLRGVRGGAKMPEQLRPHQVHVGANRRFNPPPVSELAGALDSLEKYMNLAQDGLDSLLRAFLVHYQFEAIHPFADGNGRVGRVLLAITVWRWTNLTRPWLYLSPFFERNRDEYIDRLFRVSTHGEWEEWLTFCLRGTVQEASNTRRRCTELNELRRRYTADVRKTSPRTHRIVERLFARPIVSIANLARSLDVSYPTAKNDLDLLVEAGVLQEMAGERPRTYFAPEIMRIAYGND